MIRISLFLIIVLLSSIQFSFAQSIIVPRLSFFAESTFEQSHSINSTDSSINLNIKPNVLLGIEVRFMPSDSGSFNFGLGLQHHFHSKLINDNREFNFVPVYSFYRLRLYNNEEVNVNLQIKFGYNFFSGNKEYVGGSGSSNGGLYYGLGSVVKMKRIALRLFYATNYGAVDIEGHNFMIKNSFYSAGIGIEF